MSEDRYLDPTREAFDAFKALPRDVPINMLNLLRFHEHAQYAEGHPNAALGWSGLRAYEEYGKTSGPIFKRVGGTVIWRGKMEAMVIGPDDKHWDSAFIARYPNSGAFMEMVTDPEYKKAVFNRQAAVLTSRLIRFGEIDGPDTFG
ncbi:DUF1330 domain-containing protein [Parasphingorhabdus flavimaris]|jgi:uncharacterized protein (DUF1330 family)|uniref:DUF1330 domain-containing protein n=1 Tax=Parasphingorhabdus flavimaris TaxID=266812 RepID=A0ABX2N5S7_9SPHN|nr:DUF1330 domain-containing protein [Parasphingorhabdus flavimaris]NVD29071.1 DUF1330 domain-containing protein [Parasphingorhabdus flavimaris]|tara:strand:- start:7009 stop:7446 length:438 start_codon:yes stop_codon:yes gene_type:complete